MLPPRARAKQHDEEVGSSANTNPQSPQAQFPLPRWKFHHLPSQWSLVGSFHTPIPLIYSLAPPLNRLREAFRTRRIPFRSRVCQSSERFRVVSISVSQREASVPLLVHSRPPSHLFSSFPVHAPAPAHAAPIRSIIVPLPCYGVSYNHLGSWNLEFMDTRTHNCSPTSVPGILCT